MGRNHEIKLKLKLTAEERKKLEKKAKELGLPLSTYIRMISIGVNVDIKRNNGN
ncbi:hypothetical protein LCGC14_2042650 [marine sediment metagenome]|uniref:Uncharacterized protein n=1 Tax=marine sediment metagenome TaxID=412755 RepID=A0A0F9FDY6_9ZZZZ